MNVADHFNEIVKTLVGEPGVTPPEDGRGFGAGALKVNAKIFVMVSHNRLVFKLPRVTVDDLIARGEATAFDLRHDGRLMTQWLVLANRSSMDHVALAREAMHFVAKTPG